MVKVTLEFLGNTQSSLEVQEMLRNNESGVLKMIVEATLKVQVLNNL